MDGWGKKWPPSELLFRPFTSHFMWISAHHLHLHTQKSLCSTRRALAFFLFFFFRNTSYLPVQKVTAIYSIDVIFSFDLNSSDAQLPLFPSPPTFSSRRSFNHLQYAWEVLVVAAEPFFVYLFVTWHLTSWQRSRVPKRRADVDVNDPWGGICSGPNQERPNCFPPRRDTHTHTLALAALLWTTTFHSSRTEMLNISMLCINMLYAHILPPPLLFSKCCSCCKTMHRVHFQRLFTERVHVSVAYAGLPPFTTSVC